MISTCSEDVKLLNKRVTKGANRCYRNLTKAFNRCYQHVTEGVWASVMENVLYHSRLFFASCQCSDEGGKMAAEMSSCLSFGGWLYCEISLLELIIPMWRSCLWKQFCVLKICLTYLWVTCYRNIPKNSFKLRDIYLMAPFFTPKLDKMTCRVW